MKLQDERIPRRWNVTVIALLFLFFIYLFYFIILFFVIDDCMGLTWREIETWN